MVDPGAVATWANAITVGRLLLSPLMFWVMPDHDRGELFAFGRAGQESFHLAGPFGRWISDRLGFDA